MPDIEKVLAVGGTSPLDFTLHDAGHALRVATRMSQIMPKGLVANLSVYELALLLLAAYLHDIGMTPERRNVETVYRFLVTGHSDDSWVQERRELQKWMDENYPDLQRPLDFANNPQESISLVNELVAAYCRHRHNDWSEDWIRKNLVSLTLSSYNGWIEDLVTLCRSHHEGYTELVSEKFKPRYVGSPAELVHLRYLAAVLRIADVLEVDPERTPAVILRHRNVRPSSLIYWWKDAEMTIKQEGAGISVYARPKDARVHRAIELTINQINSELLTCTRLADQTHFEKAPGKSSELPHRWGLSSTVSDDIVPRENSYEYIDGSFRPDTRKLLQLLSGVELYGDEMVAVRELLQNAFDAVREEIAYSRLNGDRAGRGSIAKHLSESNSVELCLEFSADEIWLVCRDTGVGMSKSIIRDHLLVSGIGARHDVLELERRCGLAGFSVGRTGKFGIGVLSYFMLADQVIIRTKRSPLPGDSEGHGWYFETEGVGGFGELRRDATITKGTEVRLRLRARRGVTAREARYEELQKYVRTFLLTVPCRFSLTTNAKDCKPLEVSPGFTQGDEELRLMIAGRMNSNFAARERISPELLTREKRVELETDQKNWKKVIDECRRTLAFVSEEGEMRGELGRYRIHLPYFKLPGGVSLAFLRPRIKKGVITLDKVNRGYCFFVKPAVFVAWKGMGLPSRFQTSHFGFEDIVGEDHPACVVEIDWQSDEAGHISVSRNAMGFTEKAKQSVAWLLQRATEMQVSFIRKHRRSLYNSLNSRMAGLEMAHESGLVWIDVAQDGSVAHWRPVKVPLVNGTSFPYEDTSNLDLKWKGKPIRLIRNLTEHDDRYGHQGLSWCSSKNEPEVVLAKIVDAIPNFGLCPFGQLSHIKPPVRMS